VVIYTTNAIESLSMGLRKAIKTRGAFPSEEAALKVMYLALRNLSAKWQSMQGWKDALNHFVVQTSNTMNVNNVVYTNTGHYPLPAVVKYAFLLKIFLKRY